MMINLNQAFEYRYIESIETVKKQGYNTNEWLQCIDYSLDY
ncbi:MAG: hypothetical protein ACFFAA_08865 [Promethearchaeota archaeon]